MILQIISIGTGYHVKRNGVIITEWDSVLILACFARLFIAFVNTHTWREKRTKESINVWWI